MSGEPGVEAPLRDLVEEEHARALDARDRLGSFVTLAESAITQLNNLVSSVGRDHFMAAALMFSAQKSATLAYLSHVRGHLAQAEFNARQLIEFAVLTAYMAAHPEEDVTRGSSGDPAGFRPPKETSGRAYRWLGARQPHLSALLKDMKAQINDTTAHASLYVTHFTFEWEMGGYDRDQFRGAFFDRLDEDVSRLHLMSLARLVVIVAEKIRVTAEEHGGFVLREKAVDDMHRLEHDVQSHREALGSRMGLADG